MTVQRLSVRICGVGSSWWLERHGYTTYAGMDLCNTTGIRTARRARRFMISPGLLRIGIPLMAEFGHQLDVVGQTCNARLFELGGSKGRHLRVEEWLPSRPYPEACLCTTKTALHTKADDKAALSLIAASSHAADTEYLWLVRPGVILVKENRTVEYTVVNGKWDFYELR